MRCAACACEIPLDAGASVGFRESCPGCDADLHACVQCAHHDPAAYNACREPNAERVLEPGRANRCEWFRPGPGAAADAVGDEIAAAKRALEDLFAKK